MKTRTCNCELFKPCDWHKMTCNICDNGICVGHPYFIKPAVDFNRDNLLKLYGEMVLYYPQRTILLCANNVFPKRSYRELLNVIFRYAHNNELYTDTIKRLIMKYDQDSRWNIYN